MDFCGLFPKEYHQNLHDFPNSLFHAPSRKVSKSTSSKLCFCPRGVMRWEGGEAGCRVLHLIEIRSTNLTTFNYFACSPEEFCEYFFRVCLGILHWKMAGIFGEFFLVSVSHETKHEKSWRNSGKIRSKIRGKIRDENSKNSGNFRSATFLA